MTGPDASRALGDASAAARLGGGSLEDVPPEVLVAGLALPLHDYQGLQLIGLRPVVVELTLSERTRSLAGSLHGGAGATLVDVAGNVAVATSGAVDVTRCTLLTGRLEIEYRALPEGDRVRARAEVIEFARRRARVECVVTDTHRRRIATAVVTTLVLPGGGFAEAVC
ncbi:MAG: PaaI family thioesterase [Solirubrobacterales bacterium]|nr:PaaI family thioesterase [Solirubrobacterales bacterium]